MGEGIIISNVVHVILCVIVLVFGMGFIWSATNPVAPTEQVYAKQFALIIDNAMPGMEIGVNVNELAKRLDGAEYNSLADVILIENGKEISEGGKIIYQQGKVNAEMKKHYNREGNKVGQGAEYSFFNNVKVGNVLCDFGEGKDKIMIVKIFNVKISNDEIEDFRKGLETQGECEAWLNAAAQK